MRERGREGERERGRGIEERRGEERGRGEKRRAWVSAKGRVEQEE